MSARLRDRSCERGATAVIVTAALTIVIAFLALAVSTGWVGGAKGELRMGADAAALAAARELNGSAGGIAASRAVGTFFASNPDSLQPVEIGRDDVVFCNWDRTAQTLNWCLPPGVDPGVGPPPSPTPGALTEIAGANAVQVNMGREASRNNPLPVWFSAFLGSSAAIDLRAAATAVGGGPCQTRCVVPLAFPYCQIVDPTGAPRCGATLTFQNDPVLGEAGLTGLHGQVNPGQLQGILGAALTGVGCVDLVVDGTDITGGLDAHKPVYNTFDLLVGSTVLAPVVDGGCPNARHDQGSPLLGFVTVTINGVIGPNATSGCPGGAGPCIFTTLMCGQMHRTSFAGCGFYGTTAGSSQLVR